MALWATQVWIPTGTMGEWKNTMLAICTTSGLGYLIAWVQSQIKKAPFQWIEWVDLHRWRLFSAQGGPSAPPKQL